MINSFNTVDEFIQFLLDNKIDANQFIICYLLNKKDEKLIEKYKEKFNYPFINKSIDEVTREYIDDLVKKGFIEDFNPVVDGKKYYKISNFLVTNKFSLVKKADREAMAKELWEVFPLYIFIKDKNRKVHAKTISFDMLPDVYGKAIGDDLILHDKIIRRLKAYKRKNQYIDIGLMKFIERRYWEGMEDYDKDDIGGDSFDQFEGDDLIKRV